jgi:hypothetical protein
MEEGFYDVDVNTLEVKMLYQDGNITEKKDEETAENPPNSLLPGDHGKAFYSGQGVVVYCNNGETGPAALSKFDTESGSLCEWDGINWKMIRRNQFVEVTGREAFMATGILHLIQYGLQDGIINRCCWEYAIKGNELFRLPKASHAYDGAHGWNTEWPRIRDIGSPGNLIT